MTRYTILKSLTELALGFQFLRVQKWIPKPQIQGHKLSETLNPKSLGFRVRL